MTADTATLADTKNKLRVEPLPYKCLTIHDDVSTGAV